MKLEFSDELIKKAIAANTGIGALENQSIEDFSVFEILNSLENYMKHEGFELSGLTSYVNKCKTTWDVDAKMKLLDCFAHSFFNENGEFIAHLHSNTYFIFKDCKSILDVNCKLLEWFSRPIIQGTPYKSELKDKQYRDFLKNGVNSFLNTNFSYEIFEFIYKELGNAINHGKTIEFVESGYDLNILMQ